MNRIYKLIWSKVKNCYVVTSELAKSHTKGCSGKRIGRLLAVGAVVAGLMLPMGDAGAFSSSFIEQYASYNDYSEDFMTNGGTIFGDYIGQYYANGGSNGVPYLFINNDGSIEYTKGEGVQRQDISTQVGNVAIGNFASASQGPNYRYLRTYNSVRPAFETAPSSDYNYTYNYNGKTYYYKSGYDNTYSSYDTIKVGEKVYLAYYGYPIYDDNGNYMGSETRYTEVGKDIWKVDPDNPGRLVYDYKNVDETTGQPIYDKNWDDLGIEMGGTNNVAVGNKATTTHHSSVAVGDTSTARGYRSIAIGAESEAGSENSAGDWDSGVSAVAVGDSAKAYGGTSVAVGSHAQTWSFSGIAVGNGSNAGTEYGIAIGDAANIAYIGGAEDIEQQRTAAQSIAIGRSALAQAKDVTAVGRNAQGMMRNATAYGNNAHANAWNSIAIGNKATAGLQADIVNEDGTAKDGTIGNSAVAIGNRARAEAEYTTAIGAGTWAEGWHAVAVGDSNRATGRFSTAIGAGWSINHTDGEPDSDDATDGSDAINTEGARTYDSFGANQAGGDYSSAVGYGNMTVGTQSNAFGKENKVSGLSSLGVGAGNEVGAVAVGDNNVLSDDQENTVSGYAVGSYNKITGSEETNAGAFGANNTVAGDNGYAIGNSNTISEDGSGALAIGSGNTVEGENSIAVGTGHTVTGKNSGAFGDPDTVKADSSYVVGNNSKIEITDAAGSFVIGNDAEAKVGKSVALGSESHAYRDKENGGAGAGYDVITGTNYAGDGADSATWVSTLGAVSVGGAEGDADAEIGTAATATRQITGVAAGTADTDAVNVAQLKRATLKTVVISSDNSVGISAPSGQTLGEPDENGVITFDLKVVGGGGSGGGATYTGEQTTESGEGPGEGSTTFTLTGSDGSESSMNIKAGDNVTIVEDGDAAVIKAENTTYAGEQTTESGDEPGTGSTTFTLSGSDGSRSRMNIQAGDNITITKTRDAAVIKAVNTTYKFETDRKKEGTVAATFTVTNEQTGEKVGEFQDTHNGLKNDTNKVKYDENGEGSVTITDQDGNTTTITGIRDSGGEALNRLGDQIIRMDSKIEKVGAGAAALAGLHPLDFDPDEKWHVAAGVGNYGSETAVAVGAFYQPTDDILYNIATTVGDGRNMVSGGVSIRFGQKSHQSRSKKAMAKEIIELREEVAELKALVYDLTGKGGLDPSKTAIFPDTPENHWAYDYVAVLAGNGVLEGYQDGYFRGNRQLTRYEMAAIIYRLMSKGIEVDSRMLQEFAPELARVKVDTLTHYGDGTPHIQRVRIIPQRG